MAQIKIGNVGALTNGVRGLWRVLAVDGDTLTIEHISEGRTMSTFADCFWPLLDSFAP
jgi:hypothetical protein